jgi:RNA-binding protein 25
VIKNDILDNKLKPWLSRKTKEYLSEEEPTLISMILKKVANKTSPYEIIDKIKVVFEEDTEVNKILKIKEFVIKMWRMLVYEVLKAEKLGC